MTTVTQTLLPPALADRTVLRARFLSRMTHPTLILLAIMLLAAALNFANLDAIGSANLYYTAAVKAMLQSPSNFFFVAAEPGGSVTIDKPPLGLWIQALSALVFGVNGFAVTLPQILAGIFSVPLLYVLVRRYFGTWAGLVAALVMAVMPVSVAVQRNNTMDATLIFTLLLAAWAFIRATDTGRLRWLLAGGLLVGLGFNIKMMQAFLPLPAFYALYFLAAKAGWRRKIAYLGLTTALILAVSLSWLVIVDLTPADQRPYVGSSTSNSALELALGYNGVQRLLGMNAGSIDGAARDDGAAGADAFTPPSTTTTNTDGQPAALPDDGAMPSAFDGGQPPSGPMGAAQGGGMFVDEVGTTSALRLFTQPLDNEIGWLLPFGLLTALSLAIVRPRLPLNNHHQAAVLWGGWLFTEVVFFSAANFFHAYYLAMLTPPLAALVGIGVVRLWRLYAAHRRLATVLLLGAVSGTLIYQLSIAAGYTDALTWAVVPLGALALSAVVLIGGHISPRLARAAAVGFACAAIALTSIPAAWASLNTLSTSVNDVQPDAYAGTSTQGGPQIQQMPGSGSSSSILASRDDGRGMADGSTEVDDALVSFLQANTEGMRYMMAVPSSNQGAAYVLATGRGMLYMGGFSGQDPVVDAADLQALVDAGELRYVLSGGNRGGMGNTNSDISAWLGESCTAVTDVTTSSGTLYDCAA